MTTVNPIQQHAVQHNNVDFETYKLTHATSPNTTITVYTYGGHITQWSVLGNEILYMSNKAVFQAGKGIRGGIPVVFPQFGPSLYVDDQTKQQLQSQHPDTKLPQHGFARSTIWSYADSNVNQQTGDVSITLQLTDNEQTRLQYNNQFVLKLTIVLKSTSLALQLEVTNNNSDKSFDFTALLHSYINIARIKQTRVTGLNNVEYIDKVNNGQHSKQQGDITFSGETDRVYINTPGTVEVNDGGNVSIVVKTKNFNDFVVWNPWADKAKGMSDMNDNDYENFVCIEPGSVSRPVTLEPHQKWNAAVGYSLKIQEQATKSASL